MSDLLSDAWEVWVAAGLIMMVLETLVPGAFLVWLGLAALGTGAVTWWAGLGFGWQVASCAILAAISVATGLRLRLVRVRSRVNTPQSGLVGRQVEVLSFEGDRGRVRLGDSDWPARLARGVAVPDKGALLPVTGLDGVVLVLGRVGE
jgi:membrane protein implicated in regulation of membrane protease activity